MGKFRSKLKGGSKGKRWPKGQSSSSNPQTKKFRDLAKSRFFQENLCLPSNLTSAALIKHDATQTQHLFKDDGSEMDADVVSSMAESTYRTVDSFASDWSQCSNISFNMFLKVFRSDSALHKEMLAILAAITEVIKENGGTETPTEYYCALLTTLEEIMSCENVNEDQVTAVLSLLNMGIKSVPEAVLRKGFDETCKKMLHILNQYTTSENNVIMKSVFGIITVLLNAQEIEVWSLSITHTVFLAILNPFCIHTKPKWRKAAQQAAISITMSDCFKEKANNYAGDKIAEFCKSVLDNCLGEKSSSKLIATGQTTILHIFSLMKDTICYYSKTSIKNCSELVFSLTSLNYPFVTSCGLQVLHALFSNQRATVNSKLNAQIISALYEYQPALTDVQPMVAWLTVVQQAHIHLADTDLTLACTSLPKVFFTLTQLWLSDKTEIVSAVTNALERLLRDAVVAVCESADNLEQYEPKLAKCFKSIELGLGYQFHTVWQQVLHIIGVMFEIGGKPCSDMFRDCLKSLAELRDSYKFTHNNELEHAVGAAVRSLGPDVVLSIISIQKENRELNMDRSWLLPVLKENVRCSTLAYWTKGILPIAGFCQHHSAQLQASNDGIGAHSYELLYLQLWNLFPSFCNKPTDIKASFKNVAKTLGMAISDHKELRLAVMASLRKLISHAKDTENTDDINEMARFDKNFLPILFNVYTTKTNGTDEEGQRLAALDTIQVYLSIAKPELTESLFEHALERLENIDETLPLAEKLFTKESILDLLRSLVPYQTPESIDKLYTKCIKGLSEMKNNKEQKKTYRLLEEISKSDAASCKEFIKNNRKVVQKLLVKSLDSAAVSSKGARLRCLNYLVKSQPQLTHDSVLLRSIVPEAVICCKDVNEKCRLSAFDLLNTVGDTLASHDQLQQFLTMILAGIAGSPQVISASILALASVLHNFSGALGNENIKYILENVSNLMKTPTREVVDSCLGFIKTYCTSLPSPMVGASLGSIMAALTNMTVDCKRHFRLKVRDILDRLVRKYGCDSITPHIPASDTVTYKRLRNLRKLNARKKKRRDDERENHNEEASTSNVKPKSIEDILADSESEDDMDVEEQKSNRKQSSTWIQEDADTIIDFTDPKTASRITATKPNTGSNIVMEKKSKDRGFNVASDGRLIIKDDSSSDSDKPKFKGKMDKFDSDDADSEAETMVLTNNKRKRSGSVKSNATGRSTSQSKYQAGGSGIHRPVAAPSNIGSEYKAKKARGDIKKSGKADPYAYVPLRRSFLNKRKKAKIIGQFKNIGRAAAKGAKKGSRAKKNQKT